MRLCALAVSAVLGGWMVLAGAQAGNAAAQAGGAQGGAAQGGAAQGGAGREAALQKDALARANAAEHQRELDLLGLPATRPGVGHNASEPNPANYDESKAVVTDENILQPGTLPAVLRFQNGKPVRNATDWQRRRVELMRLFDEVELGATPANTPAVTWHVVSDTPETRFGHAVRVKVLRGALAHASDPTIPVHIDMTVVTPQSVGAPTQGAGTPLQSADAVAAAAPKRVPVVMEMHWTFPPEVLVRLQPDPGVAWQQQVLDRGWGYAEYSPFSVQPDSAAGLITGVIGLTNHGQPRSLEDWGTLKAWAWGASRCLDYLATDAGVDAKRVAIMGHSRLGKAALVTMAYDPRFAVAYLSSSGAGGGGLWRRNVGEQLENVEAAHEFHWMGGNLLKYAANPLHAKDLPLDQHELLALCAPRPVFVGAGFEGDKWLDPRGMFLAAVAASPVWQLLGRHGLRDGSGAVTKFPAIETPVVAGDLAYRQHTGGHVPGPNWATFLAFAARYLDSPAR